MAEEVAEKKVPRSLFVRNLARDPQSRVKRRLRPGNKLGFLLSDGRRIRRAGVRGTQLDIKTVAENAQQLADGVRDGYLEVCEPDGGRVPYEALYELMSPEAQEALMDAMIAQETALEKAHVELTRVNSAEAVQEEPVEVVQKEPVEVTAPAVDVAALGATVVPAGKHQGKSLAALLVEDPEYYENIPRNLAKHPTIVGVATKYAELLGGEE